MTDNAIVEVFYIFGKILLLEVSHHFYSNFSLVMFKVCGNYLALAIL